jgi:hypothetical protein
MARALKILSINFPFRNQEVAQVADLAIDRALFDYDVVVIRPYTLSRNTSRSGEESNFAAVRAELTGKIKDLERLLVSGGLLIVILAAVDVLRYHSGQYSYAGGTQYSNTNYDFLSADFHSALHNGTGTGLTFLPSENPFVEVLKRSSVRWTAYFVRDPPHPFHGAKVFAVNGKGAWVGGSVPGIVFLPNMDSLHEESFFDACRAFREMQEGTSPPPWTTQVFLPGEGAKLEALKTIDADIKDLQDSREKVEAELRKLQQLKKLLYEKGKHQLEPVVREALDVFGFKTSGGGDIPGTNFEIDGRTTEGSKPGILEVKGSKGQISLTEFTALPTKVLKDFEVTKKPSKGILVGNGLCEQEPRARLGNKVFSPHTLEAAKTTSAVLINSVELYAVACGVMTGEITTLAELREKILATNGYIDLLQFCKTTPFSKKDQTTA